MSDGNPWADEPNQWQSWRMTVLPTETLPAQDLDEAQAEAQRKHAFQRKLELQARRDKARQEAMRQGHATGLAAGHAEGYAQGLEEGRLAGEAAMQEQIQATLAPLLSLCESFAQALRHLDGQVLGQLVELALGTARHIAGQALQAHPEQVVSTVQTLLQHEPALTGKPRLWLHGDDLALVQHALGEQLGAAGWSLLADASVARGGCRVSSASGELDATLESAWAGIRSRLLDGLPATS
ncbi:flagellar assembly protein FliH [Pseudomonas silvicola]|nr:flagellar assembly protein FliH [Pseudomonas silvicola]